MIMLYLFIFKYYYFIDLVLTYFLILKNIVFLNFEFLNVSLCTLELIVGTHNEVISF